MSQNDAEPAPLVGVIMGSKSDWETMRHAAEILRQFDVPLSVAWSQPIARPT